MSKLKRIGKNNQVCLTHCNNYRAWSSMLHTVPS